MLLAHRLSSLSNCSAIFLLFPSSDFLTAPMLRHLHPQRYRRSAGHQLLAEPRTVCSICLRPRSADSVSSLLRLAADLVYCDSCSLLHPLSANASHSSWSQHAVLWIPRFELT